MTNDVSNGQRNMSKFGFILSAIGAAVGLGNLWGFPTKMMSYGGPAFLVPYIICVVLLGLPFLILEINLGSKWRKAPAAFYGEYLGGFGRPFAWFQAAIQLLIGTYYAVIISWVVISLGVSFTGSLGEEGYFTNTILGATESADGKSFSGLGKIQPIIFLGVVGVILLTGFIVSFGVKKGIEAANKFMVPFLFVLVIAICIYSLTLSSASRGLNTMFTPEFSKLEDMGAWRGAFSQAFFTLSLAVSIIVVYSIHSPKDGDNTNRAVTIMAGDTLVALLACLIIASTLGYSLGQGIVIEEDGKFYLKSIVSELDAEDWEGKELGGGAFVFKMFPQTFRSINNSLNGLGNVVASCFYLAVFFAAISSMISLLEPTIKNFEDVHNISRLKGVIFCCVIQFIFGLPFIFQGSDSGGLLDIVDTYYTGYFLLISAIISGLMVVVSKKKTDDLLALNNQTSVYKLGSWYRYLVIFGSFLLMVVFVLGVYSHISDGKFAENNLFQWLFASLSYLIPFSVLVFGFGLSHLWSSNSVVKKEEK